MIEVKIKKPRKRKRSRSFGEQAIEDYLLANNISYQREYSFDGCVSKKGNKLRFDFYLPVYNLVVEYQGVHHTQPVNKKKRAQYVHLTTMKHDQIKRDFIADTTIKLLEISYLDRERIVNILNETLGII
jgi:hypothetical protein